MNKGVKLIFQCPIDPKVIIILLDFLSSILLSPPTIRVKIQTECLQIPRHYFPNGIADRFMLGQSFIFLFG